MSDDLSDLIKNFSNSNIDMNKVNEILNSLKSNDKSSSSNDSNKNSSEKPTTSDIDINTILKIKEMMDKINSSHNDKRSIVVVEGERNKKSTVGTISYLPAIFGCYLAGHVIRKLTEV